ncbi:MAG: hypothetical protein ACTSXQ_03390 [Alphaproteobacteria bacterium]
MLDKLLKNPFTEIKRLSPRGFSFFKGKFNKRNSRRLKIGQWETEHESGLYIKGKPVGDFFYKHSNNNFSHVDYDSKKEHIYNKQGRLLETGRFILSDNKQERIPVGEWLSFNPKNGNLLSKSFYSQGLLKHIKKHLPNKSSWIKEESLWVRYPIDNGTYKHPLPETYKYKDSTGIIIRKMRLSFDKKDATRAFLEIYNAEKKINSVGELIFLNKDKDGRYQQVIFDKLHWRPEFAHIGDDAHLVTLEMADLLYEWTDSIVFYENENDSLENFLSIMKLAEEMIEVIEMASQEKATQHEFTRHLHLDRDNEENDFNFITENKLQNYFYRRER